MSVEYDGVKFYSTSDLTTGLSLNEAVSVLKSFDPTLDQYNDINKVLELYNIYLLFKSGVHLNVWDDETYNKYRCIAEKFPRVYSKYFNTICDDNFEKVIENVCVLYEDDFWTLFDNFKVYNRVSAQIITDYIKSNVSVLYNILQKKNIVRHYDDEIACVLRASDETARLLIREFLEKRDGDTRLYFPDALCPSEFEGILQVYVDSDHTNPNLLSLIVNAQNSNICPISDRLRLSAKRAYQKYWKNQMNNVSWAEYGMSVTFEDSNEIKKLETDDKHDCMGIVFDTKWIAENLDYPTLLNNFMYVFEYFDVFWRSRFTSHKHRKASLADAIMLRGKNYYDKSPEYDHISALYSMEMLGYCKQMQDHGIYIGDIFKWFFEEYLPTEYGATGFLFNPPTESATTLEKCKTLVSEMDGILKQFKYYVEDGYIDRELLEISSNPFPISTLKSFSPHKYAYGNSNEIEHEMYLLFSDQSCMKFSKGNREHYSSFIEHLTSDKLRLSDFEHFQQSQLEWLLSRKSLMLNDDMIEMNTDRIIILKDLYKNDVICCSYIGHLQSQLDELVRDGDLRYGSTLLSEPEQDYFNYILNKSQFSNGLDLRNKYIHSTYPADENKREQDYLEFLKMMVLIIGKINEDFILREQLKEG